MNKAAHRILKNVSLLLGSTGVAGVCAIVALGFNTRGLGAHDFGVLSLIQAYVALLSSLTSFESWQPVVRLGVRAPSRLRTTVAAGFLLDFSAACVATVIAVAGIFFLGPKLGISPEYHRFAMIYSLSLLAGVGGTPKGYFRLKHDFKVLAGNQAALAIAMLVASVGLWLIHARLPAYVICFASIAALYNLTLVARMLVALHRDGEGLRFRFGTKTKRRHFLLMLRMATGNSVLSSLMLSRRHLALFVVGRTLGEAAAGVYSVAARLVTSVSKFALLLNQVLFSEVMKGAREVEADAWRNTVFRISWVGLLVAIVIAGCGAAGSGLLIGIVAGREYHAAAPVFALLFFSECIGLAGIHFNPIIQHDAGTWPLVRYSFVGIAVFLGLAVSLSSIIGMWGAAIGVVVSSLCVYTLMAMRVRKMLEARSVRQQGVA